MYRNKSAVSLRTLAHSLKQSITMDRQKAQTRQFIPLRNSASSINLMGDNRNSKTIVGSNNKSGNKANQQYLIMLETRKTSNKADSNQKYNRESNYSEVRYDIKATKELMMQRKQKLLEMTRTASLRNFPQATYSRTALPQQQLLKQRDELTYTLNMLQKEQSRLKQLIDQKYCSTNLKSCNKHIIDAQTLGTELKQITSKYHQFLQYKSELQNRLMFLQQDIESTKMNFNEQIAQKDQCQQFLDTYKEDHRFREQAEYVMRLVELQYDTEYKVEYEKNELQKQLVKLQGDYNQWRVEENIEFKQNKFHNKLKELKLHLMKVQTDLDAITNELIAKYSREDLPKNTIRKVREYICTFFKNHTQINMNRVSYGQIDQGMDFFLCRNQLVKQFTKYLNQNTQKISLSHGIYSLKLTQYCDCLKKIQHLYHLQNTQVHKVISDKFEQQISQVKQQISKLNQAKRQNLSQIESLFRIIQKLLSQDSLSIIELMSKKTSSTYTQFNKQQGLYNLCEIKSKVKENKLQQQKRILKTKQNFVRLKQLEHRLAYYAQENPKNQLRWTQERENLKKEIKIWTQKIQQIQLIKMGYESKKAKLDGIIDDTINKMKEKDQTEQRLLSIQKEIQELKKQKIQEITKKHEIRKNNIGFTQASNDKTILRPFCSVNNLKQQTKQPWPSKLTSNLPQPLFQLGTLKLTQIQQPEQYSLQQSAQFKITRDNQLTKAKINLDQEKMSTKTQSSPKNNHQRLSLGALNSILLSKCNLVHSKNLLETQSKSIVRSGSMYGGGKKVANKENELNEDELLLESKPHSRKASNVTRKQSMSRKNSVSKMSQQKSSVKNQVSNVSTGTKLSLSTNNRKPSVSKPQNQPKQSPYVKQKPQKDLNTLITNKLLRR